MPARKSWHSLWRAVTALAWFGVSILVAGCGSDQPSQTSRDANSPEKRSVAVARLLYQGQGDDPCIFRYRGTVFYATGTLIDAYDPTTGHLARRRVDSEHTCSPSIWMKQRGAADQSTPGVRDLAAIDVRGLNQKQELGDWKAWSRTYQRLMPLHESTTQIRPAPDAIEISEMPDLIRGAVKRSVEPDNGAERPSAAEAEIRRRLEARLSVNDHVCSFSQNVLGSVTEISGDRVRVSVTGKVKAQEPGFLFQPGADDQMFIIFKAYDERWFSASDLAECRIYRRERR